MSLSDVVDLTITTQTVFPTRAGFGIPLFACYHTRTPNRVEFYTSEQGMLDDGFLEIDPAYEMAQKAFSQNPRPVGVYIGKRILPYTKTVRLIPVNTTQGFIYLFKVAGPNRIETTISYTVPGAATVASIVTALTALIDAIGDVTAVDAATHVTVSSAAGTMVDFRELPTSADLELLDVTADPGIVTDLNAIEAVESKGWYGLALDSMSEAEINAAAAWIEARRKIMAFNSSDTQCAKVATTTDVFSDMRAAAYARTTYLFSRSRLLSYSSVAWMCGMLPLDPGSNTWAYRTLRGITVDTLTDSQETGLKGKSASFYVVLGGLNTVMQGKQGNTGAQEWIDITVGVDWLYQEIQLTHFGQIKAASDAGQKIPYTNIGAATLKAGVESVLDRGIQRGLIAEDPPYVVTFPTVASQAPADRAARHFAGIQWAGTLQGAIHSLQMRGNLSV